jgi:hypothetical protein
MEVVGGGIWGTLCVCSVFEGSASKCRKSPYIRKEVVSSQSNIGRIVVPATSIAALVIALYIRLSARS